MGLSDIQDLCAKRRTKDRILSSARTNSTSDQRECLTKIFGSIVDEGQSNQESQAQIINDIKDFITKTVLGKGNPDYCQIYQKRLDDEYKKIDVK